LIQRNRVKQSKAKQSKAKQSKAKQSKAKQSKAKQSKARGAIPRSLFTEFVNTTRTFGSPDGCSAVGPRPAAFTTSAILGRGSAKSLLRRPTRQYPDQRHDGIGRWGRRQCLELGSGLGVGQQASQPARVWVLFEVLPHAKIRAENADEPFGQRTGFGSKRRKPNVILTTAGL
jgi:hypothetical protein